MNIDLSRLSADEASRLAYAQGDVLLSSLYDRIADLENRNADMMADTKHDRAYINELEGELIEMKVEIDKLTSDVKEFSDEIDGLEKTIGVMQKMIDNSDMYVSELESELRRTDLDKWL